MNKTMQKQYDALHQQIKSATEWSGMYRIKIPAYLERRRSADLPREVMMALIVADRHNQLFAMCVRDNDGMLRFLQENP
jgi:hypothetical protein